MCNAELTSISMYFKLPRASSAWNDFKNWMHLSVARNGKTSQRSRFNLMCSEEGSTHLFQLCSRDSPSVSRLQRGLRRRDGPPLHPEFVHRRLKIHTRKRTTFVLFSGMVLILPVVLISTYICSQKRFIFVIETLALALIHRLSRFFLAEMRSRTRRASQ